MVEPWSSRKIQHWEVDDIDAVYWVSDYFNPSFVEFFQSTIPGRIEGIPSWLNSLHAKRLSFLYFGLLLLGCGIGAYLLAAPEQLRRFPSVSDYISEMETVWSAALVRNRFDETISRFLRINTGEHSHPTYGINHPSFPSLPAGHLHDLIASIYEELPQDSIPEDVVSEDPEGSLVESSPYFFVSGSGHVLTSNIMEIMHGGRRVDMAFWSQMHESAIVRRKEVFFVEHLSLDYSRFGLRSVIASLFLAGFFFLFVPTVTTSALVLLASFTAPHAAEGAP
jgi:hypothetical protein